jgi:hypothetical protein
MGAPPLAAPLVKVTPISPYSSLCLPLSPYISIYLAISPLVKELLRRIVERKFEIRSEARSAAEAVAEDEGHEGPLLYLCGEQASHTRRPYP